MTQPLRNKPVLGIWLFGRAVYGRTTYAGAKILTNQLSLGEQTQVTNGPHYIVELRAIRDPVCPGRERPVEVSLRLLLKLALRVLGCGQWR